MTKFKLNSGPFRVPIMEQLEDSQHQDVKNDNSDRLNSGGGLEDIRAIIRFLEASGVSCCVVDVPALNYYGAKRVVLVRTLSSHCSQADTWY